MGHERPWRGIRKSMTCRAIRGATTADSNTAEDIHEATIEMLRTLIALNSIEPDDLVSLFFTTTSDLNATFPAVAARELGLEQIPLMCAHEMSVPGALDMVLRVLVHVNTAKKPSEIRHVYLKRATELRPEWAVEPVGAAD
jgi:chorismate mutase